MNKYVSQSIGMSYIKNDDCFKEFLNIDKGSINLVVVDLPYGQTSCEWDSKIDLKEMWIHLKRICCKNCVYCFFTTTKFGVDLINSNPKWFRYDLVWEKNVSVGFLSCKKLPLRSHEMIYIFGNPSGGKKTYNVQMVEGGKPYNRGPCNTPTQVYGLSGKTVEIKSIDGSRFPKSVMKIKTISHLSNIHPTQKPVDLCKWLIKSYSNEGDTILDFTMGSGSTIVACIETKRKYIGIEKDEEIFNNAKNRIEDICSHAN